MADSDVSIVFTGNEKDAAAAITKLEKKYAALEGRIKRLAGASRKSSKGAQDGLAGWAGGLGKMVLGYASVGAAIRLVSAEVQNLREQQEKTANVQVSLAQAQSQLVQNLPKGANLKAVLADISAISAETGVSQLQATQQATDAFAKLGGLDPKKATEAIRASALLSPFDREAAIVQSGAALTVQQAFPEVTAKQSLGFLSQVGTQTPVTSAKDIAENVAPAITQLKAFGDTAQQGGALFAALSQGAKDKVGRKTLTASINLAKQLEEFATDRPEFEGATSTFDRIKVLQNDKNLRGKLLPKLSTEARFLTTVRSLLGREGGTDSERVREDFDKAFKAIDPIKQGGKVFEERVSQTRSLPAVQARLFKSQLSSTGGRIRAGDLEGGLGAIAREGLQELADASGDSAINKFVSKLDFDAKTAGGRRGQIQTVIDEAERRQRGLLSTRTPREDPLSIAFAAPQLLASLATGKPSLSSLPQRDRTPSAQDRKQAEQLKALVEILKGIKELVDETREARRENRPQRNRNAQVEDQ